MPRKPPPLPPDFDPALLLIKEDKKKPKTRRARRSPTVILIAIVLALTLLALIAWWVWPKPNLPQLQVIAFDQATVTNSKTALRARVLPVDKDLSNVDLAGCELHFQEKSRFGQVPQGDPNRFHAQEDTDKDGWAEAVGRFPAPDLPVDIEVGYAGRERQAGARGQARVYVWPASVPLLLVDAGPALTDAAPDKLRPGRGALAKPREGAGEALVAKAQKYRIVYLAVGPDDPLKYREIRTWLTLQKPGLPEGPVLGRESYGDGESPAQALRRVLKSLRAKFDGPMIAVARRAEEARIYREEGIKTFLVGEIDNAPEGVKVLESWKALTTNLP